MNFFDYDKLKKVHDFLKKEFPDSDELYISIYEDRIAVSERPTFYAICDEEY